MLGEVGAVNESESRHGDQCQVMVKLGTTSRTCTRMRGHSGFCRNHPDDIRWCNVCDSESCGNVSHGALDIPPDYLQRAREEERREQAAQLLAREFYDA